MSKPSWTNDHQNDNDGWGGDGHKDADDDAAPWGGDWNNESKETWSDYKSKDTDAWAEDWHKEADEAPAEDELMPSGVNEGGDQEDHNLWGDVDRSGRRPSALGHSNQTPGVRVQAKFKSPSLASPQQPPQRGSNSFVSRLPGKASALFENEADTDDRDAAATVGAWSDDHLEGSQTSSFEGLRPQLQPTPKSAPKQSWSVNACDDTDAWDDQHKYVDDRSGDQKDLSADDWYNDPNDNWSDNTWKDTEAWDSDWPKDTNETLSEKGDTRVKGWKEFQYAPKIDRTSVGQLTHLGGSSEDEIDTLGHDVSFGTWDGNLAESARPPLKATPKATPTSSLKISLQPSPSVARPSQAPSVAKTIAVKRRPDGEGWSGRPWKASREDAKSRGADGLIMHGS